MEGGRRPRAHGRAWPSRPELTAAAVCSAPSAAAGGPCSSSVSLFTSLAAVSLWAWRTFVSSEGFADVATDMLHDPDVRTIVSQQIVTALADQKQTAQAVASARPVLEQAVAAVVATNAFQGVFHAGVTEIHAEIVSGSRTRLLVPVNDTPAMVKAGPPAGQPGRRQGDP